MIFITQDNSPTFWQIYLDLFPTITIEDALTFKWYFLFSYIAIVLFDRLQSIHLDDVNVIRSIFNVKKKRKCDYRPFNPEEMIERMKEENRTGYVNPNLMFPS